MNPRIMSDFNLKDTNLWKKIRKQALTKQIDIIETRADITNINTPLHAFVQSMSTIETLKPILTNSTLPDFLLLQL